MRKIAIYLVLLLAASFAYPQANAPLSLSYTFSPVAAVGQLGSYLVFAGGGNTASPPRPSTYTVDWSVSGTVPTACTFRVEGSSDGVNWYGLDVASPSTVSCVASNMEWIANRPVLYLRVNVVSYAGGDATTRVVFHYTGAYK